MTAHPTSSSTTDEQARRQFELIATKSLGIQPSRQIPSEMDATSISADTPAQNEFVTEKEAAAPEHIPGRPQGLWWWAFNASIWVGAFIYGLDTTIAANIQPQIYLALGELTKLSWIGTGFVMGSVATLLLWGHLYSLFNLRWLFAAGYLLFAIGSVLCGAPKNMNTEIAGRVIAGMGGASVYLGALNYAAAFTGMAERPMYEAGIGFFWGLGTIVGPLIGGGLAQASRSGWRWAFYINVILGGIEFGIVALLFPNFNPSPNKTVKEKLREIDYIGATLIAAWFCFFVTVLAYAGTSWTWHSGGTIALWVLWGVITIAFAVQQGLCLFTTEEHRIFPVEFLWNRNVMLCFVATSAIATSLWITIYFTPLFFQFTLGDGAVHSAIRMLPLVFILIFILMLSGITFPLLGRPALYFLSGGILVTAAGAAMFREIKPDVTIANIYGFLVLIGAGVGICMQLGYAIAAGSVPPHRVPAAIGIINIAQIGSGAIALSMASSIFQNLGQRYLRSSLTDAGYHFTPFEIENALAGADSAILSGSDARARALAIAAIDRAIAKTFALVFVGGAVCAVCALGLSWKGATIGAAALVAEGDVDAEKVGSQAVGEFGAAVEAKREVEAARVGSVGKGEADAEEEDKDAEEEVSLAGTV